MMNRPAFTENDRTLMKRALRLAAKGRGRTSPNPMVGAVVVRDGEVVGEGYHEEFGAPHAEVNALNRAGEAARGATVYVTLEPCNHHGKTPPCTDALLKAGVERVIIGMRDPNPHVEGYGGDFLHRRGMTVSLGLLERECRELNQAFIKHVTRGIPYVIVKAAATLDGRIATRAGDSRWISNERSRAFVHELRCAADAVLIGIGTAVADDPLLTARPNSKIACRQPVRVVLDRTLRIPPDSQIVRTAHNFPALVVCGEDASSRKEEILREKGVDILRLPERDGRLRLGRLLDELGKRQVACLLVEGGGQVIGEFIERRFVDEFHFFYAPKILCDPEGTPLAGGHPKDRMSEAHRVVDLKTRRFGGDVLISGRFREEIY